MKIASQTFRAAVGYLSEFGNETTPLLFRPVGGDLVVSCHGKAYGEYRCSLIEPLDERFAVPLRIPSRLAAELPDDQELVFAMGSALTIACGANRFVSPFVDVLSLPEMPKVFDGITFRWSPDVFLAELRAAVKATATGRRHLAMQCVNIEVLPARETICATDGHCMTVYEQKDNGSNGVRRSDSLAAKALIHRSDVPLILSACKSMGQVRLRVGVHGMVVECGSRMAIVPVQDAIMPNWRDVLDGTLAVPVRSAASVDRDRLLHAIRLVKSNADPTTGSVRLVAAGRELEVIASSDDSGAVGRCVIGLTAKATGRFSVSLAVKYLMAIVAAWPSGSRIQIQYRGVLSPVVLYRPRFRGVIMPVASELDALENVEQAVEAEHGSTVVSFPRGDEPGGALGRASDGQRFFGTGGEFWPDESPAGHVGQG